MGAPASAIRRKGIRARRSVAVLVAFASLAVAPTVRADPGETTDAVTPAASGGASAPGHAGGDPGSAADPQGNAGTESEDTADRPGNAGEGADLPGNSEKNDVGSGNAANAPGHADGGPGAADDNAEHQGDVDQKASVDQKADASASAGQRDVENTSVAVRIDEPGNGKTVGQENLAAADADASVSTAGDTAGSTTVQQEANADAGAAQSGASNTAVVVRVGSAGDDEGVSQLNLATGGATASATSDGLVSGSGSATAGATQDGVTNTSVSVRVFSPGDDGLVSQLNAASATSHASAEDATEYAAAQQDDAQNTSVSIRVESPGSSAGATQQNQATAAVSSPPGDAAGAGSVAIAVSSDSRNTTLAVAVGGADLDRPGPAGLQVWIWNWAWQRDESDSLDGLAGAAMTSWTWDWDGGNTAAPGGTITSRAADEGDNEHAGSWEWSWDWSRTGVAGWAWGWNWQGSLPCSSCIWIWNWTWSWTGQPEDDGSAVPPAASVADDASPAAQLNAAQAQATAAATASLVQVVSQDGAGGGTQWAGQLTGVVQEAGAVADAQQADVGALAWSADDLDESNVVTSDAAVALSGTIAQGTDQVVDAADRAAADQWGGQEVELAQAGRAEATSSQHDAVLTGPGTHSAASVATAAGTAAVDQQLFQDGVAGGGSLTQWSGQLALIEQALDADATVVQTGTRRSRLVGGTAGASASATDLVLVEQLAGQSAARVTGTGSQAILQAAYAAQDASAHAATTQRAGAAELPAALSDADALNRAAIVQEAAQSSSGALDLQDISQTSVVVQRAVASSVSFGGIAGSAAVVNCGVTHQAAAQSTGSGATLPDAALSAFCAPAASPQGPSPVASAPSLATGDEALAASGLASATAPAAGDEEEATVFRGSRAAAAAGTQPPRAAPAAGARSARLPVRLEPAPSGNHQFSALPSSQARFDSRPGSYVGVGDAGREPLLPPAGGGPPTWVSALAAAVSGAGSSGIAAILVAFVLVPPLLLRTREASVVRRPTDVLAPIDVPV